MITIGISLLSNIAESIGLDKNFFDVFFKE